jgi:hypothetical protein
MRACRPAFAAPRACPAAQLLPQPAAPCPRPSRPPAAAAAAAAAPRRLPADRREHEAAVEHRLGAQPAARGGGVVPGQEPAAALAVGAQALLGRAAGRRPGVRCGAAAGLLACCTDGLGCCRECPRGLCCRARAAGARWARRPEPHNPAPPRAGATRWAGSTWRAACPTRTPSPTWWTWRRRAGASTQTVRCALPPPPPLPRACPAAAPPPPARRRREERRGPQRGPQLAPGAGG